MATLDSSIIRDLHKGVAKIEVIPTTAASMSLNNVNFSDADLLYSLKDSFAINEEEASEEVIKVDQGDAEIDTDIEAGQMTFSGNLPSIAEEVFDYFYTSKGAASTSDGYSGKSYSRTPKSNKVTCRVTSESGESVIVFANVKLRGRMVHDDMDNPLYIAFVGTVLTNEDENAGDFAILHRPASAQA